MLVFQNLYLSTDSDPSIVIDFLHSYYSVPFYQHCDIIALIFSFNSFLVDGCEPFSEDLWNEIKINEFVFVGGELCYRCKVKLLLQ